MTDDARIERWLREVAQRLQDIPQARRDGLLAEMRHDLHAAIRDRRAARPHESEDEATLAVLAEFGTPEEIAEGRGRAAPGSADAAPARERRARTARRRVGLLAAGAVLLAAAVVIAVLLTGPPTEPWSSKPYDRQASLSEHTGSFTDDFTIPGDGVVFVFHVDASATEGDVRVRLLDPGGVTVFEDRGRHVATSLSLTGGGTWRVAYDMDAFTGSIRGEAFVRR